MWTRDSIKNGRNLGNEAVILECEQLLARIYFTRSAALYISDILFKSCIGTGKATNCRQSIVSEIY